MFNLPTRASLPWRTLAQQWSKSTTSLGLALGLAAMGAAPALAGEAPRSASPSQPLADGVYLYGQSPDPEQIGAAYMVFEVTQGDVVGAFYMPRSSFDCFHGNLEADRVALTVIDSYEQTPHEYAVAYETSDSVAMAGGETIAPVSLEGFHRIETVSENDQRLLSSCKADL
ncbi:hypothetical protein IFO70_12545 [Phormidium tenue FACHB-886]|nr:hypothetical protein [Phormidium tenue FACHB-886]